MPRGRKFPENFAPGRGHRENFAPGRELPENFAPGREFPENFAPGGNPEKSPSLSWLREDLQCGWFHQKRSNAIVYLMKLLMQS